MKKILLFFSCIALLSACTDSEKFWNDLKQIDSFNLSAEEVMVYLTETKALEYQCSPEKTADQFTWSSADESIVSVDMEGNITGVAVGETTVTAVYLYSEHSDNVTVKVLPIKIRLSPSYELMEKQTLKVTFESFPAMDATVFTWSIADESIATVDGSGNVKGVAEGRTTLKVEHRLGATATADIVVKPFTLFSGGAGSEADPYLLATPQDLVMFSDALGGRMETTVDASVLRSAHYKVNADIDLKDVAIAPVCNAAEMPFTGTLDGNGHTLTNLSVTNTGSGDAAGNATGLIGYLGQGGHVMDLTLGAGCVISSNYNQTGSIAGYSEGTIENCTFAGEVKSSGEQTGGIVGNLVSGSVKGCKVDGKVSSEKSVCGGIAGLMEDASVVSCVFGENAELVSAAGTGGVGGIVGSIAGTEDIEVSSCAIYGDITGQALIGGVLGYADFKAAGQRMKIANTACIGSVITTTGLDKDNKYHSVGGIIGYVKSESNRNGVTTLDILGCVSRLQKVVVKKVTGTNGYIAGIAGRVNYVKLVIADCYTDFINEKLILGDAENNVYTWWGSIGGSIDSYSESGTGKYILFPYAYSLQPPTADLSEKYRQLGGSNLGGTRKNYFKPSAADCQIPAAAMTDGTLLQLLNDAKDEEAMAPYADEIDDWVTGEGGYPIPESLTL